MTITPVWPVASSACIPLEEDWSDWEDDLSDEDFSATPSQDLLPTQGPYTSYKAPPTAASGPALFTPPPPPPLA